MGKMEKHMRDWVQAATYSARAASAFNAHLDKQGLSHDFGWHLDVRLCAVVRNAAGADIVVATLDSVIEIQFVGG